MYAKPIGYESTRRDWQMDGAMQKEITDKLYAAGFLCAFVPQCEKHNQMLVVRDSVPMKESSTIAIENGWNERYTEMFTSWRDNGGPGGIDNFIMLVTTARKESVEEKEKRVNALYAVPRFPVRSTRATKR
jgi:hypothetical protein